MPHEVVNLGPASVAYPIVGAAAAGGRLHLVSRNLSPARMAVFDLAVQRVVATVHIPEGAGAWGMAAAGDRYVYLGQFGARARPNLFRYDRSTATLRAVALLDVDYIWALAAAQDGAVYGVTAPDLVFCYRPSTDRAEVVPVIDRLRDRVRSVAVDQARVYVGGARDGRALLLAADRHSLAARSIVPAAVAAHETVYVLQTAPFHLAFGTRGPQRRAPAVGVIDRNAPSAANVGVLPASESLVDTVVVGAGEVWCTARPSGALYRFDLRSGGVSRSAVPVEGAETRGLFAVGGTLVGVASTGHVWRYRPADGSLQVVDVVDAGAPAGPEQPQALAAGDAAVYTGGNFGFSVRDLRTLAYRRHLVPGEPKDLAVAGSTVFVPLYPTAELWAYAAATATLGRVARWPPEQNRPVSVATAGAGQPVIVSTVSDGRPGGALQVYDPVARTLVSVADPLGPEQSPAALAVDGGTVYVAGGGAQPALAAADARTGARRWLLPELVPAGTASGLAVHDGLVYAFTTNGWAVVVDPVQRRVLGRRRVAEDGGRLRSDGRRLWAATRAGILQLHPRTLRGSWVAAGPADVWGWPMLASDGAGEWYGIRQRNVLRVRRR